MDKRGTSHIGFIISFAIFVVFVVFLYFLISPQINTGQNKTSDLKSLSLEIMNNLTISNITSVSVSTSSPGSTCVNLSGFFPNSGVGGNVTVTNGNGAYYPSLTDGSNLYINTTGAPVSQLFVVRSSPDYPYQYGTMASCTAFTLGTSYLIAGTSASDSGYVSSAGIRNLISEYSQNYYAVKTYFGLAPGDDFGLNFTYQNQTTIGTNEYIPSSASVYAEQFPVVYLNQNSTLEAGVLTIEIW